MVQGKKGRISLLLCRMYFLLFYSEEIRMSEPILVLSHNAALSGLIARTLRWREVYSTILPVSTPLSALRERSVRGVILAGDTPEDTLLDEIDPEILKSGLPVLALGSAAPLLCRWHGGSFRPWEKTETSSAITFSDIPLFREIASGDRMLHHYAALSMADGLVPIAEADGSVVGFCHETLPHFGIQYPIERHDPDGALLLTNFALEICGAKADWNMDTIIDLALDEIRQDASADGKILCAVSGGVDSTVCARLVSLAAGARLRCILVDNGMFHEGEPELIQREFLENLGISLERIDAQEEFLEANLTQNAYYGDGGYAGESCPKSIKHVVKDQETFDGIFAEAWIDIDFEKEMLVLCFFTCYYMGRPYEINKISVDNQALEIKVKSVRPKGCFAYPSIPDASTPMQRCFAVKMDKLDIEETEFSISD